MKKPLNPEAQEFLTRSNEALQRELEQKKQELDQKDRLIGFYEDQLKITKPENEVKVPLHERYPAAFRPLNEQILS